MLSGECRLLALEGEERLLQPWDFVHSPPLTEHSSGGGDGPCVILMTGASSRSGYAVGGVGGALPGVAARGALRRERGGGDRRLEAGVRDGRAVPSTVR